MRVACCVASDSLVVDSPVLSEPDGHNADAAKLALNAEIDVADMSAEHATILENLSDELSHDYDKAAAVFVAGEYEAFMTQCLRSC